MYRKPAATLVFLLAWVCLFWLLGQKATADNEANRAYIPLVFNNYPPPPPQQYFDDFSDPTRNWFVGADEVFETSRVNGEYHLRVKRVATLVSVIAPAAFGVTDYTLDVDVRQVDGDNIAYGLVLDWLDWNRYAVLLVVPGIDQYALLRVNNGQAEELISWTAANHPVDDLNHISIRRWGTSLDLYINGALEAQALPLHYTNHEPTRTGLTVLTIGTGEATAAFDNFHLVELRPMGAAVDESGGSVGVSHHVQALGWRP